MNVMTGNTLDPRGFILSTCGGGAPARSDVTGIVWQVSCLRDDPFQVVAADWMAALGIALREQGRMAALGGLACEQVTQHHIIINDFVHSERYVIQKQLEPAVSSPCDGDAIPLSEAGRMSTTDDDKMFVEAFESEDRVTEGVVLAKPPEASCDVFIYQSSAMFVDPCDEDTLIIEGPLRLP